VVVLQMVFVEMEAFGLVGRKHHPIGFAAVAFLRMDSVGSFAVEVVLLRLPNQLVVVSVASVLSSEFCYHNVFDCSRLRGGGEI